MSRENYFMGLLSLAVLCYLIVLGMQRFFPKAFRSKKFTLEHICKWEEIFDLLRNAEIRKWIWITLGFFSIFTVGKYIPLPGLNLEAVTSVFNKSVIVAPFSSVFQSMSIFSLGIMPFLSANSLVLLLSIVVPRLRRYSQSAPGSNQIIIRWIYYLTIVLCLTQGYFISRWLQNPEGWPEGMTILSPGMNFTIVAVIFMTMGTIAILLIANGIRKLGIGHGISLIITFGMCLGLLTRMFHIARSELLFPEQNSGSMPVLFITVIGIILGFWILQIRRVVMIEDISSGKKTSLQLSINQSGIIPVEFASSLIMLPATLLTFSDSPFMNRLSISFGYGQPAYYTSFLVLIIIFSLVYGRIAFNPKYIAKRLKQKDLRIVDEAGEDGKSTLIHILLKLNLMWAGVLAIYFVLLNVLCNIWPIHYRTTLLVIPAVTLGCLKTILRRNRNLKEIYAHTELGEMLVAKSYLEVKGIETYLDNAEAYGRLYCYFIGPLAAKQLFVSPQDYPRASELIEEYNRVVE